MLFLSFLCEGDTFYEQKTAGYVQRDGHRRLKTQKRCPRLLVGNADWRAVLAAAAAAVIAKAVSAAAEGQQDQDPDDRTAVIAAVASAVSDPIAVAEAAAEDEQEQDQTAVVRRRKIRFRTRYCWLCRIRSLLLINHSYSEPPKMVVMLYDM